MTGLPNAALIGNLAPVQPAPPPAAPAAGTTDPRAFQATLARTAAGVQFSNHALQRLERRGITVDQATLQRLDGGVQRAAQKGSRDAVVLIDSTAFVVSVQNRTVITAVGREHMKDHVFTNIDSAVIA